MKKSLLFTAVLLFLAVCLPVMAQENTSTATSTNKIFSQTEITPADLGVSGMGWLNRIWLNIRTALTTDPVKKSELEAQKANIAILLAKNKLEKDPTSTTAQTALQKAEELQTKVMTNINERLDKAQTTGKDTIKIQSFIDKYAGQQLNVQTILQKLITLVPANVQQNIAQNQEVSLQSFGTLMNSLQSKEQLQTTFKNFLQNNTTSTETKIQNLDLINKIEALNPGVKDKIKDLKIELKDTIKTLEAKRLQIIKDRQSIIKQIQTERKDQGKVNTSTKQTIKNVIELNNARKTDIKTQIGDLKTEVKQEIGELRNNTSSEISTSSNSI